MAAMWWWCFLCCVHLEACVVALTFYYDFGLLFNGLFGVLFLTCIIIVLIPNIYFEDLIMVLKLITVFLRV